MPNTKQTPSASVGGVKTNRMKHTGEKIFGLCFAGIPVLGFLIFGLAPIVIAICMSFMKIKGFNLNGAYGVGFENYRELLFGEFAEKTFLSIG
ncbi:MAG: sugar ABC transporter permease, partial [Clostridia bacterium]|nr:sugar ABC transporter permease [Clostridia bacterium]